MSCFWIPPCHGSLSVVTRSSFPPANVWPMRLVLRYWPLWVSHLKELCQNNFSNITIEHEVSVTVIIEDLKFQHGQLSRSLILCTITATTCAYCPAPFCLVHWASMSNSETTLERHWQMERERTATETRDEEPLHCTTYMRCYLAHPTVFYSHLVTMLLSW